jgi:hypothetical protein
MPHCFVCKSVLPCNFIVYRVAYSDFYALIAVVSPPSFWSYTSGLGLMKAPAALTIINMVILH